MSVSPLPLHWRFFAALPVGFFRARSGLRLDNGNISIHLWEIGKANHLHFSAVIQACGGNLLPLKHVIPTASCEYALDLVSKHGTRIHLQGTQTTPSNSFKNNVWCARNNLSHEAWGISDISNIPSSHNGLSQAKSALSMRMLLEGALPMTFPSFCHEYDKHIVY